MLLTGRALPVVPDLYALTELVRNRPGLFLRYSKGPEQDAHDGPSEDYEAGVVLPGLSVTTLDPEPWWPRSLVDWVARRVCKYDELGDDDDRKPWLLAGRVVGYGPDHEPLVAEVEAVAWIASAALEEARRHYRENFDVGRDSRTQGTQGTTAV